jgi:hypothetical protein
LTRLLVSHSESDLWSIAHQLHTRFVHFNTRQELDKIRKMVSFHSALLTLLYQTNEGQQKLTKINMKSSWVKSVQIRANDMYEKAAKVAVQNAKTVWEREEGMIDAARHAVKFMELEMIRLSGKWY